MIVEALSALGGVAVIAGGAIYALRSVRVYADRALAELESRRLADVDAANARADLRIADANTAAAKDAAQRERRRGDALERIARDRIPVSPVLVDDGHGFDVLLGALRAATGDADPVLAGDGGGGTAAADRLRPDRGPAAPDGGEGADGPATVPGA